MSQLLSNSAAILQTRESQRSSSDQHDAQSSVSSSMSSVHQMGRNESLYGESISEDRQPIKEDSIISCEFENSSNNSEVDLDDVASNASNASIQQSSYHSSNNEKTRRSSSCHENLVLHDSHHAFPDQRRENQDYVSKAAAALNSKALHSTLQSFPSCLPPNENHQTKNCENSEQIGTTGSSSAVRASATAGRGAAATDAFDYPYVKRTCSTGGQVGLPHYQRHHHHHQDLWLNLEASGELPVCRAAHSADVVGGSKLYIFGGWNGSETLNDLQVLDTNTMTWKEIKAANPPSERNNHASVVLGYRLFIHAGHDGLKWIDDFFAFDTEKVTWQKITVAGLIPTSRACHTLSRVNEKIYLFGGYNGKKCFNDIDVFDLDTQSWIRPRLTGALPPARNAHSMTVVESRLFLFGGHSGNRHLNDLHVLDTTTLSWSQPEIFGQPPPGLRGHSATLMGDRLFIFGGYDSKERSNNLYILETKKFRWVYSYLSNSNNSSSSSSTEESSSIAVPSGRQRHSASLVGAKNLFVFGGFNGSKWLNDLYLLDLGKLTEDALTDLTVKTLTRNFKRLVGNPKFSDVTLVVDGFEIPAHKCILSAQCEFFNAMFSGEMVEAKADKVVISGWTHEAYVSMIEFLYTGCLSENRPNVICDILGLADHYTLDCLKTMCENILKFSLDYENVCMIFMSADKYQAQDLRAFCNRFIFEHADEVSKASGFQQLATNPSLLMEITKLSLQKLSL